MSLESCKIRCESIRPLLANQFTYLNPPYYFFNFSKKQARVFFSLVACKCHVSSCGGKYFHGRNRQPPREIPRGATRGHACKNEVVIEWYRIIILNYMAIIIIM